jgi:hypothetical protein
LSEVLLDVSSEIDVAENGPVFVLILDGSELVEEFFCLDVNSLEVLGILIGDQSEQLCLFVINSSETVRQLGEIFNATIVLGLKLFI